MTASAVFGDITGVLKETKDGKNPGNSDILNDLHYKQFAVSWNKHDYELDPKSCIEDIFLGGTGFKKTELEGTARGGSSGGSGSSGTGNGGQESTALPSSRPDMASSVGSRSGESGGSISSSNNDAANRLRGPYLTGFGDEPRPLNPHARLLSEEEEREDLRSWKLREVY
ncbi:hypothetical protein D0Z00_003766 [Geotrichum galactomycetum]|uniref:Uncharacterized protein n=1 Tax=Geotrichum galactomycetum TaxID=27317 RepID=A0ACB6V0C6_9ASCO|nr:hypothetical protein D0Z00_003766 [Geotrichum candidum]